MKIVTYNINKGMDNNNRFTIRKIVRYLKELQADIICIQEVFYSQFAKLKLDLNMDGIFACNIINSNFMYGICTLSKYEIQDNEHILLYSEQEQRGFLFTNILTKYGKFNIVNTHLGSNKNERRVQLNQLLDYTNKLSFKTIICGDFNEENISISKYNDTSVYTNAYKIETYINENSRIDYIFSDKIIIIDNYSVDFVNFSKHYPVICTLR